MMRDPDALKHFRLFVEGREDLIKRLLPVEEPETFIAEVVAVGAEYGFLFDADDVRAALHMDQQLWLASWTPVV